MEFDNNILLIIGAVVLGLGLLFFKFFSSNKSSSTADSVSEMDSTSMQNISHENMNMNMKCDGDKCPI